MATVKARRRTSVPQAKNVMLRAMQEILDPSPLDVGPEWDHFESRCAYCDLPLDIGGRSAHIDHAEAAGGNHIEQPRARLRNVQRRRQARHVLA